MMQITLTGANGLALKAASAQSLESELRGVGRRPIKSANFRSVSDAVFQCLRKQPLRRDT
jgi:hypothetical protein